MNQEFMKKKPILPLVISMALPMTISMLVNALYNIVDGYFVAKISEDGQHFHLYFRCRMCLLQLPWVLV